MINSLPGRVIPKNTQHILSEVRLFANVEHTSGITAAWCGYNIFIDNTLNGCWDKFAAIIRILEFHGAEFVDASAIYSSTDSYIATLSELYDLIEKRPTDVRDDDRLYNRLYNDRRPIRMIYVHMKSSHVLALDYSEDQFKTTDFWVSFGRPRLGHAEIRAMVMRGQFALPMGMHARVLDGML